MLLKLHKLLLISLFQCLFHVLFVICFNGEIDCFHKTSMFRSILFLPFSIKFRLCQNSSRDGEAVLPVGHVEGGDGRVVGDLQRASLDRGLDVTRKLPVLQDRMFCCHFYDPSNIEMFPQWLDYTAFWDPWASCRNRTSTIGPRPSSAWRARSQLRPAHRKLKIL